MRIFLAASTVFLVAGSPYGPPPSDNEVYPTKTNIGCSSIDGCGDQGSSSLSSSKFINEGIKLPQGAINAQLPGRPYWWEGQNNPFKAGPGSSVSGSVTTSGFSSSGSSGTVKVSTPFGNSKKNIQDIASQKCLCPVFSACVHWQLCNNGIMIVDGSVIIDQSNLVIPNQVSTAHGSCGRNMICCQIPTCENGAQDSNLQSQNKPLSSFSNQNDQTPHFSNVKTQFNDQSQSTHDFNNFSFSKVKNPTTFESLPKKEDSPLINILPTDDLNNSHDSEKKHDSTSHVSQKFPGIQEIVPQFGVSSQTLSESHDGPSANLNPEPEVETGKIHSEYLAPLPNFPKSDQTPTSFGSDQSTLTSGQVEIKFPSDQYQPGLTSQSGHQSQGSFEFGQKKQTFSSGQSVITKKTELPGSQYKPQKTGQQSQTETKFESDHLSDITGANIPITDLSKINNEGGFPKPDQVGTKYESDRSQFNSGAEQDLHGTKLEYGHSEVSTGTGFPKTDQHGTKFESDHKFTTGEGLSKHDKQKTKFESGHSQINTEGGILKPSQHGTKFESVHSQISTVSGFSNPDQHGNNFGSGHSQINTEGGHSKPNQHGTEFESNHSQINIGAGFPKPGQQGTKFESSHTQVNTGLPKPGQQGTKFESGHVQISPEDSFPKPGQHGTEFETGHSQISTGAGFPKPGQQETKYESGHEQISPEDSFPKPGQHGTEFETGHSQISTGAGFPKPGQQETKYESGHEQISPEDNFPKPGQHGTEFDTGHSQISTGAGFPKPGQQGTKYESGHAQISHEAGFPKPGQYETEFQTDHSQISTGAGLSKPGQQGTKFESSHSQISTGFPKPGQHEKISHEFGFSKPGQYGTEFETGHSQINPGAGFPEPGQQGTKYESDHSQFNNGDGLSKFDQEGQSQINIGVGLPQPSQQEIKFSGHSQVKEVTGLSQPDQYDDSRNTEIQSQGSGLNLKGVVLGTIGGGTRTATPSPVERTTTMMMMMGPMLVGGKMMLNGEIMTTASGNQLISGSCSAGTFCLPKSDCNPYNGFIILYANQQVAASFSNAPTVPLLGCKNDSEGAAGESFCCQLPHPLLGPDGKPFD